MNIPPKILVTGANGQVGWELTRSLMPLGEVIALDRVQCDLSRPEIIPIVVQEIKPDVIVNAAAYTAVDKAEEEEALATIINGAAVGVLAEEARKLNSLFVHYSTDYVFDGAKTIPYTEEDTPNPINAYGRSKLAGEEAIRQVGCDHLILRTSWVYASRGNNFLLTILKLKGEDKEIKVVSDQIGSPTSAFSIAESTKIVIEQTRKEILSGEYCPGIYNLTSRGYVSWFGFAQTILKIVNELSCEDVLLRLSSISTADYNAVAQRPCNSRLSVDKIEKKFTLHQPGWEESLGVCINSIKSS